MTVETWTLVIARFKSGRTKQLRTTHQRVQVLNDKLYMVDAIPLPSDVASSQFEKAKHHPRADWKGTTGSLVHVA